MFLSSVLHAFRFLSIVNVVLMQDDTHTGGGLKTSEPGDAGCPFIFLSLSWISVGCALLVWVSVYFLSAVCPHKRSGLIPMWIWVVLTWGKNSRAYWGIISFSKMEIVLDLLPFRFVVFMNSPSERQTDWKLKHCANQQLFILLPPLWK